MPSRLSAATSAHSDASQSRRNSPVAPSTSSAEPTFTTISLAPEKVAHRRLLLAARALTLPLSLALVSLAFMSGPLRLAVEDLALIGLAFLGTGFARRASANSGSTAGLRHHRRLKLTDCRSARLAGARDGAAASRSARSSGAGDFAPWRAAHRHALAGNAGHQKTLPPLAFSSAARFLASSASGIASILLSATISGFSPRPWP